MEDWQIAVIVIWLVLGFIACACMGGIDGSEKQNSEIASNPIGFLVMIALGPIACCILLCNED